ncbi:MAG: phosphohydrolase [Clostridia bacterium]|nr:phosphohydrolase [Clostridia bacterium]
MKGDPITTYSGISFYVLEPEIDKIKDEDIAHALSLLCRGNGHYRYFYSVAQHCLNCLLEARARGYSQRIQMACLIHDGSEAYISDITRPVKQYLTAYHTLEQNIQELIYERYGIGDLTEAERTVLGGVDDAVLYYEFEALHIPFDTEAPEKKADFDFSLREAKKVEEEFLKELSVLRQAL